MASGDSATGSRILKFSQGPPRYIVKLHLRLPFYDETTNKAVHSMQALGKSRNVRAENLSLRPTTSPGSKFHARTTSFDSFQWPHAASSQAASPAYGRCTSRIAIERHDHAKRVADLYGNLDNGVIPGEHVSPS
jgi:hypothetical protein